MDSCFMGSIMQRGDRNDSFSRRTETASTSSGNLKYDIADHSTGGRRGDQLSEELFEVLPSPAKEARCLCGYVIGNTIGRGMIGK